MVLNSNPFVSLSASEQEVASLDLALVPLPLFNVSYRRYATNFKARCITYESDSFGVSLPHKAM